MVAEADEVGIWYGMEDAEFQDRVRTFLKEQLSWADDEIPELVFRSFVTKSFGNKDNGVPNNESLVFYGKTVVDNILASKLLSMGTYEPSMMSETRNYCMFPNAYACHLFDNGIDFRRLLRITISRDKTGTDVKLNYIIARIDDAFEALVGALDLTGNREMAEAFVQKILLDEALIHSEELKNLGDAEMRKRWKKITFQRTSRFKEMSGNLIDLDALSL